MSEFKTGDYVCWIGKVVDSGFASAYPIEVRFDGDDDTQCFTKDGKAWADGDISLKKIEPEHEEITRLMNAIYDMKQAALKFASDQYGSISEMNDICEMATKALAGGKSE